ncbi:MAG: DUF433 domain-containing protein [Chloroflexota bacterium]|nr:DUF433 domain-containing protein [Chloroflexota bacterium]
MFNTPLAIEEVVSNPDVRGGVPVLAGTTIRVVDLIAYHLYGDKLTPEQLAEGFHLFI